MKEYERLESAHAMSLETLTRAQATAAAAAKAARSGRWQKVASQFDKAAEDIERILKPTRRYAESVLDRELSAAAAGHEWDPGELVCAAVTFGLTSEGWDDPRLLLATNTLSNAISGQGKYPASRPFHYEDSGSYRIITFQVTRYLAILLRRIDRAQVGGQLARRLLAQFKFSAVFEGGRLKGWAHEDAGVGRRDDWVTAEATLALAELNRALDQRINAGVYGHFSVQNCRRLRNGLSLADLFYGDYGFERGPHQIRRDSLAISLEEARAHVHGFGRRGRRWPESYSMVLYGPPGTGKTTLVEALATSSGVPLVQVTPSDIVMGGTDEVERRARATFSALSLLTATIILFDEFDPVVWKRDPNNSAQSVFAFLTPGMLPKLKELHRTAKRRRVAYVLITNMVGSLDDAALRPGRFDKHIGVFPPDPLSRLGRLVSVACAKRKKLGAGERSRIDELVRECAGQSMELLARPGWFSPMQGEPERGMPLHYVLTGQGKTRLTSPEASVPGTPAASSKFGIREWQEWKWITTWDNETKGKALVGVGPHTIEATVPASD